MFAQTNRRVHVENPNLQNIPRCVTMGRSCVESVAQEIEAVGVLVRVRALSRACV